MWLRSTRKPSGIVWVRGGLRFSAR
jgi:hypothetical protein